MARPDPLGHMTCPECDHPHAEIRAQKNGKLYRYCPECDAQYFARTDAADAKLRARLPKAPAPEPAPKAAPKAAPPADPAPPAAKPAKGSIWDHAFGAKG